jgi:hypothetical protein
MNPSISKAQIPLSASDFECLFRLCSPNKGAEISSIIHTNKHSKSI